MAVPGQPSRNCKTASQQKKQGMGGGIHLSSQLLQEIQIKSSLGKNQDPAKIEQLGIGGSHL
jgi:hypothetical protein